MVLLVAVFGTGMVYLDQTAVTVAMPSIQVDLGVDISGLQWMIDIYILSLATLMLIGGALGDRYGRVRVLLIGMVIFVLTSVGAGFAQTLPALLIARGIQGIGGAMLVPSGLAIINASVEPVRRGRAIGNWATLTSAVIALGPTLGGFLIEWVGWRAVFFLNVPLGILAFLIAWQFVPESRNPSQTGSLDWPGVISLLAGLGGILFSLIEGPHLGWNHPYTLFTLILGVIGWVTFIWVEHTSKSPLISLKLFREPTFSGINLVTLVYWVALTGILFFLTLNLQQIQGFTPFQAGLAVLPISTTIFLLSNQMGKLINRIGSRPLIMTGLSLGCIGFLLFAIPGVQSNYWTTFFPATLACALGLGILVTPLTSTALAALPQENSGIASGINNAASRVANMIGVAVFGGLLATQFRTGLADRLAELPVESGVVSTILNHARDLGATTPPAGVLSSQMEIAVRLAIQWSFVDSFRIMMMVCALLTLFSIVITWRMVNPDDKLSPSASLAVQSPKEF